MLWPRGMEIKVNSFKCIRNFGCFRQDLKKKYEIIHVYEHISMYYKQRLLEFILLCFIPGAVPEKFQRGLEVDVEVKLYVVNVNPGIFF